MNLLSHKPENTIDTLNLFLLLLSFLLVLILPFHIFLFSYAVLGPLHYLSQITWLHDKDYFLPNYSGRKILLFLSLGTLLLSQLLLGLSALMIAITFLTSFVLLLQITKMQKILLCVFIVIISFFISLNPGLSILFGILLPTLIHVFIFTLLFMWQGAVKSKSLLAKTNAILFFILALSFFIIQYVDIVGATEYIRVNYQLTFSYLHELLFSIFKIPFNVEAIFNHPLGIAFMQFTAFSYTYHYLNWFSKTSVIGWNESAKKNKHLILSLWVIALFAYGINYTIGVSLLATLSFVHVLLEFPLDAKVIMNLFRHYINKSDH